MPDVDSDDVTTWLDRSSPPVSQVVPIITLMAKAYTRGNGFKGNTPNEEIAAVVTTASARPCRERHPDPRPGQDRRRRTRVPVELPGLDVGRPNRPQQVSGAGHVKGRWSRRNASDKTGRRRHQNGR